MDDIFESGNRQILCNKCEGCSSGLHLAEVNIFHRSSEDSDIGDVINTLLHNPYIHPEIESTMTITKNTSMRNNPSARRNGVELVLICESCGDPTVVSIAEHKGIMCIDKRGTL